jgi:clathrin heavy chain
MYAMVIGTAENQDCFEDLVQYLLMARSMLKEQMIDSELIFAYAKCGSRRLSDLETFISEPNQADIQRCGDRCYDEKLYEAARILYTHIGNNQKLATTLVRLK